MRFNTLINNLKCKEWGLNASQGALFDLLNQIHSWASPVVIMDDVYYHIARTKVIKEIPLFYSKSDTVYRHFKVLEEEGLIEYRKLGKKDLVRLTSKGNEWNSEMNPSNYGNESEKNTDTDPTYNNTSSNNNTIDKREEDFKRYVFGLTNDYPQRLKEDFVRHWTEPNRSGTKMKFEMQQTFEASRRLATWASRDRNYQMGKKESPHSFEIKPPNYD